MANFTCSKSFPFISENKFISSHPEIQWDLWDLFPPTPLCQPSLLFSACQGILLNSSSSLAFFSCQDLLWSQKVKGEDAGLSAQHHLPQEKRAASEPQGSGLWFCHPPRAFRSPPCHSTDMPLKGDIEILEEVGPPHLTARRRCGVILSTIPTACHSADKRTGTGASTFSVPWWIPNLIGSLPLAALKASPKMQLRCAGNLQKAGQPEA